MEKYLVLATFVGSIIALLFVVITAKKVLRFSEGTPLMQKISQSIRQGANAYLKRQYSVVGVFFACMVVVLCIMAACGLLTWFVPFAFLTGGFFSGLSGFIGMKIATASNCRTANACQEGLNRGLRVAFSAGSVMGFTVVGLGLLDISVWFFLLRFVFKLEASAITSAMLTFGMGASSMALFARVGGGIFTKAADVGADLVGKVEAGIPEDDPRNPATIADNVGDNVGDVAGLGSDLLESYVGAITSGIILAFHMFMQSKALGTGMDADLLQRCILFPLVFVAIGLIACCIGVASLLFKAKMSKDPHKDLNGATYVSAGATMALGLLVAYLMFRTADSTIMRNALGFSCGFVSPWIAAAIGIAAGVIVGAFAERYTSAEYRPTQFLAKASLEGPALTITQGMALGMKSCMAPCIVLAAGIIVSYKVSGMYGVAMAAMGMLSFVTATVSVDTYGPISDNAGGIAEMSGLDPKVREITDTLDSVGNTTAAIGKGFAIGSGVLAALALMISYLYSYNEAGTDLVLNLIEPMTLAGAIVGGALPFLFSGILIDAVAKAARKMVDEVRRQFKEIPGILDGSAKPDYKTCIEISSKGAIGEMKLPSLLAIVVPVGCGFIFGAEFVGGLLIGSVICSCMLAIFTGNAGGAWDNGKKYIEAGGVEGTGKGTPAHDAAVVGDTVGDPLKDTVGPCLDIFIKIMSTVSLVVVGVFSHFNLASLLGNLF